jgi:hypothetical protein
MSAGESKYCSVIRDLRAGGYENEQIAVSVACIIAFASTEIEAQRIIVR